MMIRGYREEIEKIYESIRQTEDRELRLRREEIKKKHPEILSIEREIGKLCVELSISSFKDIENRETHLKNLRTKITDLRMKKCELLVQHNYSQDYLERHYACSKCKDIGFIGNARCTCYKPKLVKLYYYNSELKDMLFVNNFENFNFELFSSKRTGDEPESPRKSIEKIVNKAWNYVENFSNSNENFLFFGNSGTGKTFLSHCIAKELLDRGFLVVYRTADDLIQNLRAIKMENDSQTENLLMNCDLLIIDDLGTEQINSFSKTELFNLLNKRLLKSRRILVSTNYTIEDLSKTYSERITSRLFGNFTLCKFYGEDIRVKKNLSKLK